MDRRVFGAGLMAGLAGLAGVARADRVSFRGPKQVEIKVRVVEVVRPKRQDFEIGIEGLKEFGPGKDREKSSPKLSFNLGAAFGENRDRYEDEERSGLGLSLDLGGSSPDIPNVVKLLSGATPAGQARYDKKDQSLVLIPTVDTRRIDSLIILNRESIYLLGGLIKAGRDDEVPEIPPLAGLPVIGNLFRSKRNFKNRKALILFIRPSIYAEPGT